MHGGPGYGGLRRETWLPLAPGRGRWATWSTTPAASRESRASATTTCWGRGVSTSSPRSAHLTARVLVAPGAVRGLAPVAEKVEFTHGPIPAQLFELGLRWFQDAPDTERLFAVRWDGDAYRLVVPPQGWSPSSTPTEAPAPSFSATDDRDEQGFRIYGVVGRLDALTARAASPGRRLRPLRPAGLAQGVRRPGPRRPARGAKSLRRR